MIFNKIVEDVLFTTVEYNNIKPHHSPLEYSFETAAFLFMSSIFIIEDG
jgi:hypothetical protein